MPIFGIGPSNLALGRIGNRTGSRGIWNPRASKLNPETGQYNTPQGPLIQPAPGPTPTAIDSGLSQKESRPPKMPRFRPGGLQVGGPMMMPGGISPSFPPISPSGDLINRFITPQPGTDNLATSGAVRRQSPWRLF